MPKARVQALLVGLGVSLATAVLMLATEPLMAIGWDEGYILGREARMRDWFRGLRDPASFAAQWRPLPRNRELVQCVGYRRPPAQSQLDSRPKLSSTPRSWSGFGRFARKSRTATLLSTPCSAWSATSWLHPGRSYHAPGWGRSSFLA